MSTKILAATINFSNYSTESKFYDNSNKLAFGKMKNETIGIMIDEFLELKPKMYSFLVDHNSGLKKQKAQIEML